MRIPTLVLRKFTVNTANDGSPVIEIVGRPRGLLGWILTILGLNTETQLVVTDLVFSIRSASLSGEFNNFVPLPHVSSTHCGYKKPLSFLVTAAVFLLVGIVNGMTQRDGGPALVGGAVVAVILVIAYFLSKKISIVLVTDGGVPLGLNFKPSVLDGVDLNIAYTTQALKLLNEKVLAAA